MLAYQVCSKSEPYNLGPVCCSVTDHSSKVAFLVPKITFWGANANVKILQIYSGSESESSEGLMELAGEPIKMQNIGDLAGLIITDYGVNVLVV